MRKSLTVNDRMQQDYRYERVEPTGRNFHPEFKPDLTPADMLHLGVFGGKYMTDCGDEFPASWFRHAKLASGPRDKSLNYFGVDASQPLSEWRGMDPPRRSTRLVSMVLPVPHGPTNAGRGRLADQTLEGNPPSCASAAACVRAWRYLVPQAATASVAALGI
jgi:hypothetical protein